MSNHTTPHKQRFTAVVNEYLRESYRESHKDVKTAKTIRNKMKRARKKAR